MMKSRKTLLTLAGVMMLALATAPAFAAGSPSSPATTTFAVSATVPATCVVSATALTFGSYVPSAVLTAQSTISTTCTNTTSYTVSLNEGATPSATVTTRQMKGVLGAFLNYGLFRDAAHSQNWGKTPGTDTPASASGNGNAQALTVYGQIPSGQYLAPDNYTDSITVTVAY